MKTLSVFLLGLLFLFSLVAAGSVVVADEDEDEDAGWIDANEPIKEDVVLTVTDQEGLDSLIKSHKVVFVKFFQTWCTHCKRLIPVWETLGETFAETKDAAIVSVDCGVASDLCSSYDVHGYPSLKMFKGAGVKSYGMSRDVHSLTQFIRTSIKPSYRSTDSDVKSKKSRPVFLFIGDQTQASFDAVAFENNLHADFIQTTGAGNMAKYGVTATPAFIRIGEADLGVEAFKGKMTLDNMRAWVAPRKYPLVVELGPENFHDVVSAGRPTLITATKNEDRKDALALLRTIAKGSPQVTFGTLDSTSHHEFLARFGFNDEDSSEPFFSFILDDNRKVHYEGRWVSHSRQFEDYLTDFANGELQAEGSGAGMTGTIWYYLGDILEPLLMVSRESPILVLSIIGASIFLCVQSCVGAPESDEMVSEPDNKEEKKDRKVSKAEGKKKEKSERFMEKSLE